MGTSNNIFSEEEKVVFCNKLREFRSLLQRIIQSNCIDNSPLTANDKDLYILEYKILGRILDKKKFNNNDIKELSRIIGFSKTFSDAEDIINSTNKRIDIFSKEYNNTENHTDIKSIPEYSDYSSSYGKKVSFLADRKFHYAEHKKKESKVIFRLKSDIKKMKKSPEYLFFIDSSKSSKSYGNLVNLRTKILNNIKKSDKIISKISENVNRINVLKLLLDDKKNEAMSLSDREKFLKNISQKR